MATSNATGGQVARTHIETIRESLLRRIWLAALAAALIGALDLACGVSPGGSQPTRPICWSRCSSCRCNFAGKRVPIAAKKLIVLAIPLVLGIVGVFAFGLLGGGAYSPIICCMITGMLFPPRASVALMALSALIVASAGALFVSGTIALPFDANLYARSAASWVTMAFAVMLLSTIVLMAMAAFQNSVLSLVAEVERQRDVILHQAMHDQLTGLPLLRLAADRLDMAVHAARRSGGKVALLFLDLDGFKQGQRPVLAMTLATRYPSPWPSACARRPAPLIPWHGLGGDEFLIILQGVADRDSVAGLARNALDAVAAPIPYRDQDLSVRGSIGISLFPDHAEDAERLKGIADEAMYAVKRAGKGSYAFAEPSVLPVST
ncbi:MAG: diguanylate cyclase [Aliidongia sp.]